jgi:hypothetical protein
MWTLSAVVLARRDVLLAGQYVPVVLGDVLVAREVIHLAKNRDVLLFDADVLVTSVDVLVAGEDVLVAGEDILLLAGGGVS